MTQELKAFGIRGEENGRLYFAEVYTKREVDAVLAEKDAEIAELKTKLENVDELVKAANKFVSDLKSSDCSKKDEEIRNLKQSVKFFSETLERERESAKKCFMKLLDDGLLMGWGLTEVFFVMPKYTKERLAKLEEQESEIARLKDELQAAIVNMENAEATERRLTRALWIARAESAKNAKCRYHRLAQKEVCDPQPHGWSCYINGEVYPTGKMSRKLEPHYWCDILDEVERKCRAKAEEYK